MSHSSVDDGGERLISERAIISSGQLFVDLLCQMKHNGAVEKCIEGFQALVERQDFKEADTTVKTLNLAFNLAAVTCCWTSFLGSRLQE